MTQRIRWLLYATAVAVAMSLREEDALSLRHKFKEHGNMWPWSKETDKSAMYDSEMMHDFLKLLERTPLGRCGSPLRNVVPISADLEKQFQKELSSFFAVRSVSGKQVIYGDGVGWNQVAESIGRQVLGRLLKVGDVEVDGFTDLMDLAAHFRVREQPMRQMTFDFGTDLRSCWASLEDLEGRPVCDSRSIADLAEDVAGIHAETDETGKSGSSIVTNMRRFIIKNFKDDEDPEIVREVMPTIGNKLAEENRKHGGCYRTAIAPICAVLDMPDIHKRVHWSVMRKVELPAAMAKRTTLLMPEDKQHDEVDFLDLKGPKFSGIRDGKSHFAKAVVWHRKDAGFTRLFPSGLPLRACGSREAAATLELDSELLRDLQMTDYSLFLVPYQLPSDSSCPCQHGSPRWPLVLDADPKDKSLRFAVGVIDYFERAVSSWDKMFHFSMSTMKKPNEYQNFWMRMWPMYFHIPRYEVNTDGEVTLANDPSGKPVDELKPTRSVAALQKIKWRGESTKYSSDLAVEGKVQECYFAQIPETSSSSAKSSNYKVYAGDRGTILQLTPCVAAGDRVASKVVISWERYADSAKVFEVSPEQIMAWDA